MLLLSQRLARTGDVDGRFRFSMLFEAGYEPPSKKSCPSPRPGPSLEPGAPLDCTKSTESNGADLRIRQVGSHCLHVLSLTVF